MRKDKIYKKYLYIVDEYYKIYGNNFSKEELEKLYAEVITLYLSNSFEVGIKDFIYNKFAEFIEGYNFEKRKLKDLVIDARNGNKKAREIIILHYTKMVTSLAPHYNYAPLDDMISDGIVKLINVIDYQIYDTDCDKISHKICGQLRQFYNASQIKYNRSIKEEKINNIDFFDDELDNKIKEIELDSFLKSIGNKKATNYFKKYYYEGYKLTEISKDVNVRIDSVKQNIKMVSRLINNNHLK